MNIRHILTSLFIIGSVAFGKERLTVIDKSKLLQTVNETFEERKHCQPSAFGEVNCSSFDTSINSCVDKVIKKNDPQLLKLVSSILKAFKHTRLDRYWFSYIINAINKGDKKVLAQIPPILMAVAETNLDPGAFRLIGAAIAERDANALKYIAPILKAHKNTISHLDPDLKIIELSIIESDVKVLELIVPILTTFKNTGLGYNELSAIGIALHPGNVKVLEQIVLILTAFEILRLDKHWFTKIRHAIITEDVIKLQEFLNDLRSRFQKEL